MSSAGRVLLVKRHVKDNEDEKKVKGDEVIQQQRSGVPEMNAMQ